MQPAAVRKAIRGDTLLVSVMLANNEIGTIQPLKQIAEVCHEAGVPLHTDAAQAVGKIRTNVDELDVDLLTMAGHKMYAPQGVGASSSARASCWSLLHGGGQEAGLRAGTKTSPASSGLGAAAASGRQKPRRSRTSGMEALRDRLLAALRAGVGDGFVVHGELAPRLPNTLSLSFPGASGHEHARPLPRNCARPPAPPATAKRESISPTLAAMGVASEIARGTIRLSLGWYTTRRRSRPRRQPAPRRLGSRAGVGMSHADSRMRASFAT